MTVSPMASRAVRSLERAAVPPPKKRRQPPRQPPRLPLLRPAALRLGQWDYRV